MRTSVVTFLAAASAVSAQSSTSAVTPAPVVTGNPAGAAYTATLPEKAGSPLRGSIYAVSGVDGTGVKFSVSFSGLPETGGPFMYHIHEKPVPSNGNCSGTGAHLDPYKRGEVPICDAAQPQTCQTGDLSGKYGNLTSREWSQEYLDPYSATRPDSNAFFGNLSFVLHLSNKTRIGCANFTMVGGGYPVASPSAGTALPRPSGGVNATASIQPPVNTPVGPTPTTSPPAQFTGAAARMANAAVGAVLFAAAAFVL